MSTTHTTAPAQVLHMRRERSRLTAEQQCTRCGEAAVVTPDGAVTESCIWHHEDDAREALHNLETELAVLRTITDAAGHLIDAALLAKVEEVTAPTAALAAIRAELQRLGAA